jgi:Uma2 family endonuclease
MLVTINPLLRKNGYPTSDGKPMAETDWHRELMVMLIEMLRGFYAGQQVYVTGNLLVFYEPGNRRRHVSPDVWLARGVENRVRLNYLIWEEPRGPEFVIELTSSSTRREDQRGKLDLYRDVLKVREYFLFDPFGDYLEPRLQGYRLRKGAYQGIRPRNGRLPSQVTGLHLEGVGDMLRLWDPQAEAWLLTPAERRALEASLRKEAEDRAAQAEDRAAHEASLRKEAQDLAEREVSRRQEAEAEVERLLQELERLRHQREAQE